MTRHYHLDHLGSVRQITGAVRQVLETRDYLPFGRELSASEGKLQFTGHERDSHTPGDEDDLDYMHARYYTPHLGRFLSTDPVASADPMAPQTWNKYTYVRNNPLKWVDRDGRQESLGTLQFVMDERAVLAGKMTAEEFRARNTARGAGALAGLAILEAFTGGRISTALLEAIGLAALEDGKIESSDQQEETGPDGSTKTRGLEKQLRAHEKKLERFKEDPDSMDNKDFLKNAPGKEARERIIKGRVRNLEPDREFSSPDRRAKKAAGVTVRVTTEELREVVQKLLSHLEQSGTHSIEIEDDYYWNIPREQAYMPYATPTELDMGQLSDDWSELQKIVRGDAPPIGYALVWLSAILRSVGEKTVA